jgi:hypothetical protein
VVILVVVAVGVMVVAIVAVVIHAAVVLILAVVLELWYTTRSGVGLYRWVQWW